MAGMYDQCEIAGNTATSAGGGVSGGAVLNRCVVRDNTSGANGGGACEAFADNCLFYGNSAPSGYGGGFHKGVMNNFDTREAATGTVVQAARLTVSSSVVITFQADR